MPSQLTRGKTAVGSFNRSENEWMGDLFSEILLNTTDVSKLKLLCTLWGFCQLAKAKVEAKNVRIGKTCSSIVSYILSLIDNPVQNSGRSLMLVVCFWYSGGTVKCTTYSFDFNHLFKIYTVLPKQKSKKAKEFPLRANRAECVFVCALKVGVSECFSSRDEQC